MFSCCTIRKHRCRQQSRTLCLRRWVLGCRRPWVDSSACSVLKRLGATPRHSCCPRSIQLCLHYTQWGKIHLHYLWLPGKRASKLKSLCKLSLESMEKTARGDLSHQLSILKLSHLSTCKSSSWSRTRPQR